MDTAADLAAPRERGGRGRAFRSRGRGRRARGRGRGATVLNGEDVPQYIEYESTASIEEIVDSDDVAPTEEVAVALVEEVEAEGSPEELLEQENGRGGRRGRGRGRGGRGRRGRIGRGRGGPPAEGEDVDAITDALAGDQVTATSEARTTRQRDDRTLKQRPTHFLSLPIGHHAELQEMMAAFTDALLAADPPIDGLDPTIIVPPRRLHLTLGAMSLAKPRRASHAKSPSEAVEQTPATEKPTLASAVAHLESLTPYVKELLAGEKLRVELGELNTMQGRTNRANVMWVGPPKEGEHETHLRAVAEFVSNAFKSAGFLVDEDRRLTLHCTVINTLYRKPRQKPRGFFAYTSILTSGALRGIALDPDALIAPAAGPFTNGEPKGTGAGTSAHGHKGKARERGSDPVRIDLGMWDIDEVQICEMGSHGPDGEYVCVGRIALD